MNRTGAPVVAVLSALALALVGGCSADEAPTADTSTAVATSASMSTAEVSPTGLDPGSVPVIAEQSDLLVDDDGEDTVTVGLSSLTVSADGKTMVLWLVFTPHFGSRESDDMVTLYDLDQPSFFLPVLTDRRNLKRYNVIRQDGNWWTSDTNEGATNGRSFRAWFVFAAPQDDISTLDIKMTDEWPSFLDVPIGAA